MLLEEADGFVMIDNSRLVESTGRGIGSGLDRAWKSVFMFLALMLFGIGAASLALSLLHGSSHQATSAVSLLLIYVPFWKCFRKRSKTFTITAILAGVLFMLVSWWPR